MLSTLIYLTALATAAMAQERWRHLQWNPDPLAPYTNSREFWFPSYEVGKVPVTHENGDRITLAPGVALYMGSALRFTPGKSGHLLTATGKPGEKWCIDAGLDPHNGAIVKLWQCIDNHPPQEWIVANGQVKLAGTNFCLDVPGGDARGRPDLQIWECSCNKNQAWRVRCTLQPDIVPDCAD